MALELDADSHDADWLRQRLETLGIQSRADLFAWLARTGTTLEEFKRMPIYARNKDRVFWLSQL